jgi:hypothetical protein
VCASHRSKIGRLCPLWVISVILSAGQNVRFYPVSSTGRRNTPRRIAVITTTSQTCRLAHDILATMQRA